MPLPYNTSGASDTIFKNLLLAQFAGYRTEDARAHRFAGIVDQHRRILSKRM